MNAAHFYASDLKLIFGGGIASYVREILNKNTSGNGSGVTIEILFLRTVI